PRRGNSFRGAASSQEDEYLAVRLGTSRKRLRPPGPWAILGKHTTCSEWLSSGRKTVITGRGGGPEGPGGLRPCRRWARIRPNETRRERGAPAKFRAVSLGAAPPPGGGDPPPHRAHRWKGDRPRFEEPHQPGPPLGGSGRGEVSPGRRAPGR